MTDRVVKTFDLIPMQQSLPNTTPVLSLTSATVHQHQFQPSWDPDVLAQSQNIGRAEIDTKLSPILQGIIETLSDLRRDDQNIKNMLSVQPNQIQNIRNKKENQNHLSDIPILQLPQHSTQNTSVKISTNNAQSVINFAEFNPQISSPEAFNKPEMLRTNDVLFNHAHVHNVTRNQEVPSQNSIHQMFNSPSRLSLTNQDNQNSTCLQHGKAFKQVLNDSSQKFNGIDAAEYATWKKDLQSEIADLLLTANQEIQILVSRSIERLAIIDDQATLSLVHPDVIEELGIANSDISPSTLTTTTINGTTSQMCKSVQNLMISPLSLGEVNHLQKVFNILLCQPIRTAHG